MKARIFLAVLFIVFQPSYLAFADNQSKDTPFNRLINAKTLKCHFGPGSVVSWKTGKPIVSHEFMGKDKKPIELIFDSIDINNQKARLIGNQGAGDIFAFPELCGWVFLERTVRGNVMVTTVFAEQVKGTDDYKAVTSRHVKVFGDVIPSQYHGSCKIWD